MIFGILFLFQTPIFNFTRIGFFSFAANSIWIRGTKFPSSVLSSALYELARNLDYQENLYDEIMEKLGDSWNLDKFKEMIYMQAILDEATRMYPPAKTIFRRCTRDYLMPKNDHQSENIVISKGTMIEIPVLGIHR